MQSLPALISLLTRHRRVHISILDLSGMLDTAATKIPFCNVIHSMKFCDIAKSTPRGFRACLRCKGMANIKAVAGGRPFAGHCLWGLYEAAFPVVMENGTVGAVVYVGHAVIDPVYTRKRVEKMCQLVQMPASPLLAQATQCEHPEDPAELMQIAELVADYLKILYRQAPPPAPRMHWLVRALKRHAEERFCDAPTLKELATEYHKNEKYLGRLFKREMGISFGAFCLGLQLAKAERMLLETEERVLDIALACGFNSISYFNRVFRAKNGTSPSLYRAAVQSS